MDNNILLHLIVLISVDSWRNGIHLCFLIVKTKRNDAWCFMAYRCARTYYTVSFCRIYFFFFIRPFICKLRKENWVDDILHPVIITLSQFGFCSLFWKRAVSTSWSTWLTVMTLCSDWMASGDWWWVSSSFLNGEVALPGCM